MRLLDRAAAGAQAVSASSQQLLPTWWRGAPGPTTQAAAMFAGIERIGSVTVLLAGERDVAAHPVLLEALAPQLATLDEMRGVLSAGWPGAKDGSTVIASAIGHALAFATWRSLARDQGLTRTQAVDLMVALAAGGREIMASRLPELDAPRVAPSRSRRQA